MSKKTVAFLALMVAGAVPVAASAEPFEGPYAGIQAGLNHDKVGTVDTSIGDLAVDRSRDSLVTGIFGGYDHKVAPRVVIGAEAGFSITSADAITNSGAGSLARINPLYGFDLSARAGYLVTDDTLVYARGGYDNLRARTSSTTGGVALRDKDTFDGWMVGGGVERTLTDRLTTRVEYRYSDLSGGNGKYDRHQALMGIVYRF